MRGRLTTVFILLTLTARLSGQPAFRIVSWNVENLFDCRHDSLKEDTEFMPDSERQWTWGRYWRKLEDVGRVVMGIGEVWPPALVGLCEVENDSVMTDLTRRGTLRAIGYDYVMTDSPDPRGIDVALMYLPQRFRLLGHESWRVPSVQHGLRGTRDILHAWGLTEADDTLHVVLCHLPSRAGESRENRLNRRLAVGTLAGGVDSLLTCTPDCRLVVMGDFNATLRDRSLVPLRSRCTLVPLTPDKRWPAGGTYRYRGDWSWIDHIWVSRSLAATASKAAAYSMPWMQRNMNDGTVYPRRTYLGTHYQGGVSDHYPIHAELW